MGEKGEKKMKITKIKALCKEGKAVQSLETGIIRPLPKSTVQAVRRYMDSFSQMQPDGTPEGETDNAEQDAAEIAGQIEMHELLPNLLLEGGTDDADHD